jgi:RNA binding exosome subunit
MKHIEPDQTLTVVEVEGHHGERGVILTVTVEDDDGDLITFDIEARGLPGSYASSDRA